MQGKLVYALAVALTLLAGSAFAAGPVVAHTFVCDGSPSQTNAPCPNGAAPDALIQGSDGNFYGVALYSSENPGSGGIVFSLTPAGKFTVLHTFVAGSSKTYANGEGPISLTEGPDDNLYGLTASGGNNGGDSQFGGYGVVFRISKTGTGFRVIHRFCSAANCSDGSFGIGPLVLGSDGNIYGVTQEGGSANDGAIFSVTPSSGTYEVVSSFSASDGIIPVGVAPAPDGTFYGITVNGDTLFHFDPAGGFQSVKLAFPFPPGCDGLACFGLGQLVMGRNGNLYGLYTIYDIGGVGLFEVQPDGSDLRLYPEYESNSTALATNGILLGSDGNLWLAGYNFGTNSGEIIALSPSTGKVIRTLSPFSASAAVGASPSTIIQTKNGILHGATYQGGVVSAGHFAGGTIFSLNLGLPAQ